MVMEMEHVTPRRMNWIYAAIGISYYRIGGICNTMLQYHALRGVARTAGVEFGGERADSGECRAGSLGF